MSKWYTYKTMFSEETLVLSIGEDGSSTSGIPEFMPDYLAWVAEGNTAEEWNPNGNQ